MVSDSFTETDRYGAGVEKAGVRAKPWERLGLKKKPKANSMDGLWGILNPYGDVWTYEAFTTPENARAHLFAFWGKTFRRAPDKGFRIVPVKVQTSVDFSGSLPTPGGSDDR